MKIAVFGATGPAGLCVVQEGINRGHDIRALVRSPDKLQHIKSGNLQVHKVDISNDDELVPHLRDCDAVVSVLGTRPTFFSRITFYLDTMKPIVSAMKKAHISRLVVVTSFCTVYKPEHPKFIEWLLKPLILGRLLTSMAGMEYFIQSEAASVNYTVVRPPRLTEEPSTGAEIKCAEGQFIQNCQNKIPRQDLAKFMLNCLDTTEWDKKFVAASL